MSGGGRSVEDEGSVPTLLVVDDDVDYAALLADEVKRELPRVRVLIRSSVGSALLVLAEESVDAAVIDRTPELDYTAMSEYVRYQFTFGDKTFFRSIRKVRPPICWT